MNSEMEYLSQMSFQSQKPNPRILFHIGAGKTGSTAIQNMLSKNQEILHEKSVFYLETAIRSQYIQSGNGENLCHLLNSGAKCFEIKHELFQFIKPGYLSIISSEGFSLLSEYSWKKLFESLNELNVEFQLIAFIRSPIDVCISFYNQLVKRHGYFNSLDVYIETFQWDHLNMLKKLSPFRPEVNMTVIHYDHNSRHLFRTFWEKVNEVYGLDLRDSIAEDQFLSNRGLSSEEINMICAISKNYGQEISSYIADFLVNEVDPTGKSLFYNTNQIQSVLTKHEQDIDWVNHNFLEQKEYIRKNIEEYTIDDTESTDLYPDSATTMEVNFLLLRQYERIVTEKVDHEIQRIKAKLNESSYFTPVSDGSQFDNVHYLLNNIDVSQTTEIPFNHYLSFGKTENREARFVGALTYIDSVITNVNGDGTVNTDTAISGDRNSFAKLALSKGEVLEIGPFVNPILIGDSVSYADVLNTHDLKGRALSLGLDFGNVPNIDFVVEPNDLTIINKKFDAVISSHCIEHQPDLITHLEQVSNLLSTGGYYFLLIPDHRYCFDHFQFPTTIAQLLGAYSEKRRRHGLASLIEHRSLTTHNDAARHWAGDHGNPNEGLDEKINNALVEFNSVSNETYVDVHAWYFTPESFSQIISVLAQIGKIDFEIDQIYPTAENQLEFFAILHKRNQA